MDGLVVAPKSFAFDAEALLDESYAIEEEIAELKQRKLKRGLFGGLDGAEALAACARPLILMNRQCEIKKILQGQFESDYSDADMSDADTIQTVGDYLEVLLQSAIPDRLVPVSREGGAAESSVDAVALV